MLRRGIVALVVTSLVVAGCSTQTDSSAVGRAVNATLTSTARDARPTSTAMPTRTPTPVPRCRMIYPPEGHTFEPFNPCDLDAMAAEDDALTSDPSNYDDEYEYDYEPSYCEIHDCSEPDYDQAVEEEAAMELTAEAEGDYVEAEPAGECDAAYPDFCIPPVWVYGDLECEDIDGSYFTVYDPDPHGFDADFDGVGCEWP